MPVKVLHISTCDHVGGSARSAYRIHQGLRALGVRSRVLVGRQLTRDDDVAPIWTTRARYVSDRICGVLTDRVGLQDLFYPSSFALPRHPWFCDADVVQLYNLHGGYFSYPALERLSRLKPIVWRLSDMWPMTGHCTYSYECERWKTGCGACPHLSDYPRLRVDTTALHWRLKRRVYAKGRFTIVAPSRWLAGLAAQSPLLGRLPLRVIPNGLDTAVFRPMPKPAARARVGLDARSRVLLFGAQSVQDRRKGLRLLEQALSRLPCDVVKEIVVLMVGASSGTEPLKSPCPVKGLGQVNDDETMAAIYAAADVCVVPALADNLPNVLVESLACGTPAVAFRVGGIPEILRHMDTGYLAAPDAADELAQGIMRLLSDEPLRLRLGQAGRRLVEAEHAQELQARRYLELYREVSA